MTWVAWCAIGAAGGVATGLLPGVHVNTLAAVAVPVGLTGPGPALAAVAMGVAHTVVGILPATYLGVPDEDAPVAVLPAHRMLHWGRAPEGIRISLTASLAAACAATAALPAYAWALTRPGALDALDAATPWILAGVVAAMLWRASRRSASALGWAAAVVAASGALGWVAAGLSLRAWVPVPASSLTPLLSGMFGAAGLLAAWHHGKPPPPQDPPPAVRVPLARVGAGIAAAAWTAVLPGVTSATAAAAACPRHQDDPRPALATLSAVDTAHAVLALGVLWILLRPRTGLAIAVLSWYPVQPWHGGAPPAGLAWLLATVLAAAASAAWVGGRLQTPFARVALGAPTRPLSLAILAGLTTLVAVLSGWLGLAVYVVAALLGLVPLATGSPRIHLTGALLLPALAWSLD